MLESSLWKAFIVILIMSQFHTHALFFGLLYHIQRHEKKIDHSEIDTKKISDDMRIQILISTSFLGDPVHKNALYEFSWITFTSRTWSLPFILSFSNYLKDMSIVVLLRSHHYFVNTPHGWGRHLRRPHSHHFSRKDAMLRLLALPEEVFRQWLLPDSGQRWDGKNYQSA